MSGSRVVLDVDALLASVDGDCELLDELAAAFTAEVPRWVAELRTALLRGDSQTVFQVAHGVSGSVGYFRVRSVRQRAVDLEGMGREGRLDGAAAAIDQLEADLVDLGRLLGQAPWRR